MNSQLSFTELITELGDSWEAEVLEVVRSISHSKPYFSADDIVYEMEVMGVEKTRLHAIPSVLRKAKSKGWIGYQTCSCGEECRTVKSRREGNNKRKIMVYKSIANTSGS